jgi:uncharacterized membrane protein YjjP (DUF1212 family)
MRLNTNLQNLRIFSKKYNRIIIPGGFLLFCILFQEIWKTGGLFCHYMIFLCRVFIFDKYRNNQKNWKNQFFIFPPNPTDFCCILALSLCLIQRAAFIGQFFYFSISLEFCINPGLLST